MYQVNFYTKASKSFQKIPLEYQNRIRKIIPRLEESPFTLDLKKLHQPHYATHRLRIGNYRIFLDIDTTNKTINIIEVERRTTQTYSR